MGTGSSRLRIFLSSPGDVAAERNRADDVIRKVDADLWDVDLEVARWEERPYSAVSTFQAQIDRPSECDLVVCIFWKSLGTVLPPEFNRPDGSARTGTEFEFEDACVAARTRPEKIPDIFVYRNTTPVTFNEITLTKEQAEKKALDEFWCRWLRNEEGHFLAAFKGYPDPDAFARQFERDLRAWIAARLSNTDWDIAVKGSPFRGLAAFDEKHASVFFGRRRATGRLRAALMAAAQRGFPGVFVLGASGAGKSSLVRAGLIPRLMIHGDTEPHMDRWRRLVVTPTALGGDLIAGLARALAVEDVLPEILAGDCRTVEQVASLMAAGPAQAVIPVAAALDRAAAGLTQSGGFDTDPATGLLLVVDQFEELFSADSDDARQRFLAILTALVQSGRVWLVVTMRSDFYDALQSDPPSMALKKQCGLFDVEPPSGAGIRDMIEAPARASGLAYETTDERDLAQLLESEATHPGALPMLQYTLHALFEARDGETLTLAEYDRLGGMAGALAHKAEDAFARLDEDAQKELPRVLGALASVDLAGERTAATARPAALSEFPAGTPARRLIDLLLAERLLFAFGDAGDKGGAAPTVRIAHESLFERWPRAAKLLADSRLDLDWRTRLERAEREHRAAADAGDAKGARERLLEGNRLSNAVDLRSRRSDLLSPPVIAFITDSRRAADSKRNRKRMAVAATIAVLATFGWWANEQRREAQSNLKVARDAIDETLATLESPDMQRVWGFTDIEADLLLRLTEAQKQLPEDAGGAGAHAEALMHARLGLVRRSQANVEAAIANFDRAYELALPLALAEGATPEDRALLLRIAYYRQPLLDTFGRSEDLDEQVQGVTPVAERALADPVGYDGVGWPALFFDKLRLYYSARKQYAEASNQAIALAELAATGKSATFELSILYGTLATIGNTKDETARSADFARGCALAEEFYEKYPRHRGAVSSHLYCLFGQSDRSLRNGSLNEAVRHLDQAREIAEEAARYAGAETQFRAALGAERYKRGQVFEHLKELRKAREVYGEALAAYSEILGGENLELSEHDYLSEALRSYTDVGKQMEETANASEKPLLLEEHADRLSNIFLKFIDCAELRGGLLQCGDVAFAAGLESAIRSRELGRLSEAGEVLERAIVLVDENAHYIANSKRSESFNRACDIRNMHAEVLVGQGKFSKAEDAYKFAISFCSQYVSRYNYDFYLRQSYFRALRGFAELHVAAGEPVKAREVYKACTEAFAPGCYEPYAEMLDNGVGGPEEPKEAERVRAIKANTNMKRFTVPVIMQGSPITVPFQFYIFERPPGWKYEGIEDQAIWLEKNRGMIVPQDVRDSFIKLEKIAKDNNVSFPDLAVYALGNASKQETATAEQTDGATSGGSPAPTDVAATEAEQPAPPQPEQPAPPPEQARPPVSEPEGETEVAMARPLPAVTAEPPDTVYRKALSRLLDGDLAAAGDLFADASERGHARATYELARLHLGLYEGDFAADPDRGRELMRRAADADVVAAQVHQGETAEQAGDREQAIAWYKKAAGQGNMRAKERLRLLSRDGAAEP